MTGIYFLPGLGADKRLFQKQLQAGLPITIIEWKSPLKGETIQDYAKRIAADIPKTDRLILGGVSLGGIMAIELAKILKPEKVIIISSVKNKNELPPDITFFRRMPLQRWLPGWVFNNLQIFANFIHPFFGEMSKEERNVFVDMAISAPPNFVKWALNVLATWENTEVPAPIVHIHGTSDLILPYKYVKNPITINKGRHLMIWERPEEINALLLEEFK